MEAHWERGIRHVALDLEDVNRLIEPSGLVATEASLLQGGKANTNYKIALTDGTDVVLRVYQRDVNGAPLERAAAEAMSSRLPVAAFRYLDPGNKFAIIDWMEGETLEHLAVQNRLSEVDEAAEDIGAALAVISSVTFPKPGFLGPNLQVFMAWPSTVDGLLGHLDGCLNKNMVTARAGEKLVREVEAHVTSREFELREAVGQPCLVHGDFKASNLLVNNGRLGGILDWEFAHAGGLLLDIGQLFRHADCLGPTFETRFVKGFASGGGALPKDWRELARAIDLVSLVDFLGRESLGEQATADVVGLIAGTVCPCP